ncbi:hypothetical protein OF83DRAFT_1177837 [Amylostereum chailletii]|nr:hypothetical protein OF83DRAFT_1177837 [Amylostereum chailletii]
MGSRRAVDATALVGAPSFDDVLLPRCTSGLDRLLPIAPPGIDRPRFLWNAKTSARATMMDRPKASKRREEGSAAQQDALRDRALKRAAKREEKRLKAEDLKEKGNVAFKHKDYRLAIDLYEGAIRAYEPTPIYLSNIAAAYLKLERFVAAKHYAQRAILHDPTFVKGRYRRGLARKGLNELKAAAIDFSLVLQQDPTLAEARAELRETRERLAAGEGEDTSGTESDDAYPHLDHPQMEIASASDSSDFEHEGDGEPCRAYNHEGCEEGRDCPRSHAPDIESIRDKLGKNVCLHYVLNHCPRAASTCPYAHTRAYLPKNRWYDDQEKHMAVAGILYADKDSEVYQPVEFVRIMMDNMDDRIPWVPEDEQASEVWMETSSKELGMDAEIAKEVAKVGLVE